MRAKIWLDERYPDFGVSNNDFSGVEREIPDELYGRWIAAKLEYDAVQDELQKLFRCGKNSKE